MPNGFHGPKEEWERKEAPLLELDGQLNDFARERRMTVEKNYHGDEPNRMLRWDSKGFTRTIQLSLEDVEAQTFFIGLYAWKDVAGERHTRQAPARWHIPLRQLKTDLRRLLEESYQTLEAIS
jgi:hypothetical protein